MSFWEVGHKKLGFPHSSDFPAILNALTIDVEDWFQVSRFRRHIREKDWPDLPCRVVENVCHILKLFDEYHVKATFFVLGWVAERYPELVRTIKMHGHDIGTHGYGHHLIYEQSPKEFTEDLQKSLRLLRDIVGPEVVCYRAPSYSIGRNTLWVFEILKDHGIEVDSSLFPVNHDLYGGLKSPRQIFRIPVNGKGYLLECPLATMSVAGRNFPIAGGGYLRLFPLWVIEQGIRQLNRAGISAVFYLHPWEMDCLQPRVPVGLWDRLRHYGNINRTEEKLCRLLEKFRFSTLQKVVADCDIIPVWPRW
jgi:polysaccharide deacetylase family protein (PEP-CTERM system associated)